MRDNYPYLHPLYVGQMLKPPHPVARLAYALAMWINPNNHALDGGRASSRDGEGGSRRDRRDVRLGDASRPPHERRHDGELRGAVGRRASCARAPVVAASAQAHYTHARIRPCWAALPQDRASTRRAAWTLPPSSASSPRRRRHGRRDARHDGRRARSIRCRRSSQLRDRYDFRAARRLRPTAATSRSPTISRRGPRAFDRLGAGRLASSSIRTSTACSPTAAAACCFATRCRRLLPARLAVYLLHVERAAPRRDLARVLTRRRGGGRALDDAADAAARARAANLHGCCTTAARPHSSSMHT